MNNFDQKEYKLTNMITVNQIISLLLPNGTKENKQKLRIKIYNFARTHNQPSITVKRTKYFKPTVASFISKNVQSYASELNPSKKDIKIQVSRRAFVKNKVHNHASHRNKNSKHYNKQNNLQKRYYIALKRYAILESKFHKLEEKYHTVLDDKERMIKTEKRNIHQIKGLITNLIQQY